MAGIDFSKLLEAIEGRLTAVQAQLEKIGEGDGNINIADMFQTQMLMNHLTQVSEMSTSVVSASNTALASLARGVKG